MTQEEKELLLKDLCARLPYRVKVKVWYYSNKVIDEILTLESLAHITETDSLSAIKPYLRPMSSMTEEEKAEFELLGWRVDELDNNHPWAHGSVDDTKGVDFLNSHHFDYRGLIGKGLAIAVTEKIILMRKEDKELLLKDLCARLYYVVICQIYDPQQDYGEDIFDAHLIQIDAWTSHCYFWGCSETDPYKIGQVKPYLRPESSMTKEEYEEYYNISYGMNNIGSKYNYYDLCDWLNAHHFDYRGLIEKGLALEAPEGMYGIKK